MTLNEHNLQVQNETLREALHDAIAFLKLMPRSPITLSKIAQLEKILSLPIAASFFEFPEPWKREMFTPAGHPLRVIVEGCEIRFETGIPLESGSQVRFKLDRQQIDALVVSLALQRQSQPQPAEKTA